MNPKAKNTVNMKVRTNLKAGIHCWNAFSQAEKTNANSDWLKFWECCNDPAEECTYSGIHRYGYWW